MSKTSDGTFTGLRQKIRLTIGAKLVSLIAILLAVSVASLVWLATRMFVEDNTALIQQMNADTAANLSTQMREMLTNMTDKMRIQGTILTQENAASGFKERLTQEFFSKDRDFLALFVYRHDAGAQPIAIERAISPELKSLADPDGAKSLDSLSADHEFSLLQVAQGDVQISSAVLPDQTTALAIGIPFIQIAAGSGQTTGFSHTLLALVRQERFLKAFGENEIVTSFLVDRKGKLLAHPDGTRVAAGENVAHLGVVRQLLEGKFNNGQTRYVDPTNNEAKLGAFRMVGFGGLGVVAEVAEQKAFEAARRVEYRSILVAWIILFLSFWIGYRYSGSLTRPIRALVDAAHRIADGDFKINLVPKTRDELAQLSNAFNEMAAGLEERDRVKDTFNKFHNKEIAEKLLSGEVKLGGERRQATVFFSDVRGFTALSESMQPEQVVEMLNEYMTRMVSIIRAHGGIVDKYVGDAIMALWGVPLPGTDDVYKAVRACIAMREDLSKLNELRISRGQGPLRIGMGLNTGDLIAGNIGSIEKMEYTVIGDAVNLASRIESMTKEYGTDLLISKAVLDITQGRFIVEACKSAKVKGKSQAIEIFRVLGYYNEAGQPVIVETPYSSYTAEKSDKVVHDASHADPTPPESAPQAEAPTEVFVAPVATASVPPAPQVRPATPPALSIVPEAPVLPPVAAENTGSINRPKIFKKQPYFFEGKPGIGISREEIYKRLRSGAASTQDKISQSAEGPWTAISDLADFKEFVKGLDSVPTRKAA